MFWIIMFGLLVTAWAAWEVRDERKYQGYSLGELLEPYSVPDPRDQDDDLTILSPYDWQQDVPEWRKDWGW